MPWAKGFLLFTIAVTILSSSSRAEPDAFSGAVSEKTLHFGKLSIGGQSKESNYDVKTSALSLVESNGRQSNEEVRSLSAKAKLRRLGSSVQCSNDSMILRIPGPRMPHFLVDRGDKSPVPLSEMPASCGFSLKRVRRAVSLVAPYQGCHVRRRDGRFVLPLIVMGTPVQMSCPESSCLPEVSCFPSGMTVTLGVRADDVKVKVDGSWQPLLQTPSKCSFTLGTTDGSLIITAPFTGSCLRVTDTEWQLPLTYGDREVTVSCRLAQPNVQPFSDPWRPWWYPPYLGAPATPPPTTTTAPPQYPMYPGPLFDPYFYFNRNPAAPWYPKFPPMYGFQSPVQVTTPAATTTTPAPYWPPKPYPGFPMYPPFYGSLYVKKPFFPPPPL